MKNLEAIPQQENTPQLPENLARELNQQEIELLIQLNTKDTKSFEHSLEVASIIDKKFDLFAEDIAAEGVDKNILIQAAALHDVGKIDLPDCVLNDTTTWPEFENKFNQLYQSGDIVYQNWLRDKGFLEEDENLADTEIETIKSRCSNFRDLVPLKNLFAGHQEKMNELEKYEIDAAISFMDAIKLHEEFSVKRIEQLDSLDQETKEKIKELVGNHHGYEKTKPNENDPLNNSKSFFGLSITASELVHLADVHHALSQKRSYKEQLSLTDVLFILTKDTQKGVFKKDIARIWIADSFTKIENPDLQDTKYQQVKSFIEND